MILDDSPENKNILNKMFWFIAIHQQKPLGSFLYKNGLYKKKTTFRTCRITHLPFSVQYLIFVRIIVSKQIHTISLTLFAYSEESASEKTSRPVILLRKSVYSYDFALNLLTCHCLNDE